MIERVHQALLERRRALYSPCERYRYLLEIEFAPPVGTVGRALLNDAAENDDASVCLGWSRKPLLPIIGLNPSTASELEDDHTIRREKDFAKRWGFGGIRKTNLAAFRATDPSAMIGAEDPIGPENTVAWLARALLGCCERDRDGDGNCDRHAAPGVSPLDRAAAPAGSLAARPRWRTDHAEIPTADGPARVPLAYRSVPLVLACWGAHGAHSTLIAQATAILETFSGRLYCFGLTRNGHPKHPLYLPADAAVSPLQEFPGGREPRAIQP